MLQKMILDMYFLEIIMSVGRGPYLIDSQNKKPHPAKGGPICLILHQD